MQNIYETFEFDRIKEEIFKYCKTEVGQGKVNDLKMLASKEEIEQVLLDLKEFMSIIIRFGPLPIQTSADALKLINLAKKTALLTPRDLNLIAEDVATSKNIIKYLDKIGLNYPRILAKAHKFIDLTNLENEIRRVITPSLTIADHATPELKEIRNKLKKAEAELQKKITTLSFSYASYLNDNNATLRDGHLVLPVKTVDKSKVPGIIYDVSDSGATTFIEPMEIVQMNNLITSLKLEENEEIRKILKQLTALVLLQEGEIINNNAIIGEFDFISAKALYANEIEAEIAEIAVTQMIELVQSRHPLISKDKVVANSYYIDEEKRIVIISGPNAGGKTVSLKTVGVLTMMHQCGLAIPVRSAKIGYFKNIYIDIGDNQSLSDNLSTFSAHMSHISEILNVVKGKDLVLLDELGTGTSPKEGEALALMVTKRLEKSHCLAMISSHFDALKEYAFLSENLANSSMVFDEEKLLPTYRFKLGSPGQSYALDVAKRFGIDDDILSSAKAYLSENSHQESSELLSILQKQVNENSKLQDELNRKAKELNSLQISLEKEKDTLKIKRENLLKDVEEEKQTLLKNTKDEINDYIARLTKGDVDLKEAVNMRKEVESLEVHEEIADYNETINVSDYVSIPSLGLNGTVTKISGSKARVNTDRGMSLDVAINKLHKIDRPKRNKTVVHNYGSIIDTSVSLELNIIGLRADEARNRLIKYIDNCRLKNLGQVRIIHGFGSGALRNMTHTYLKEQGLKFRLGGEHEGGGGATVVIFHD